MFYVKVFFYPVARNHVVFSVSPHSPMYSSFQNWRTFSYSKKCKSEFANQIECFIGLHFDQPTIRRSGTAFAVTQKSRLLTLLTHVWRGKTRQIYFGVKYKLVLRESTRRQLVHFANRQSRLLLVYGQNAWESFYPNTFFRLPTPDTLCKAPGLLKCETNLSQSMFLT